MNDKNYQKAKECFINSFDKEFKSKEICEKLILIAKELKDKDLETKYKNLLINF